MMMSDFIRMTGLLAGLRKDLPCFWFELQCAWNGTAIAAVRESSAGPLHTVVPAITRKCARNWRRERAWSHQPADLLIARKSV
jgi:hypothetical protein